MDGPAGIRVAVHLDGHAGAASVAHHGPSSGLGGAPWPCAMALGGPIAVSTVSDVAAAAEAIARVLRAVDARR